MPILSWFHGNCVRCIAPLYVVVPSNVRRKYGKRHILMTIKGRKFWLNVRKVKSYQYFVVWFNPKFSELQKIFNKICHFNYLIQFSFVIWIKNPMNVLWGPVKTTFHCRLKYSCETCLKKDVFRISLNNSKFWFGPIYPSDFPITLNSPNSNPIVPLFQNN